MSSDQWMQSYNQISIDDQDHHHVNSSFAYSDATAATASAGASENILSPSSTSCSMSDQLTPRGCVSKPVKRRSRASKKTPTTLLNADANNFRALVQKFTGCPSTTFSFGSKKGPVNLDFGLGNRQNDQIRCAAATSVAANYGNNYFSDFQQSHYHHHQQQQQLPQQQHQAWQEQQCSASFHDVGNGAIFETASNYCNPNGFAMDNGMFHEVSSDASYGIESRNYGYLL
ncbi:hypothetical protein AB3S75_008809 [Citrus x aurantiifolia]